MNIVRVILEQVYVTGCGTFGKNYSIMLTLIMTRHLSSSARCCVAARCGDIGP